MKLAQFTWLLFIKRFNAGLWLVCTGITLLNGCAVRKGDTVHHVVIGFGIISVPATNAVASVTRIKAVGVYGAPGQLVVGYTSGQQVQVEQTATNIVIEVNK